MSDPEGIPRSGLARPRLIPALSWFAAAGLLALGTLCIGTYVRTVAHDWGSGDRSMVFWLAFLPLLGVPLLGGGVAFAVIGVGARRGRPGSSELARTALWWLAAIAVVLSAIVVFRGHQVAGQTQAIEQAERARADFEQHVRRIQRLAVQTGDRQRLIVRAGVSDGRDGAYRWTLSMTTNGSTLYRDAGRLELHGAAAPIIRAWPFDAVFARCFAQPASPAYACAPNAEASDLYAITMTLEPVATTAAHAPSGASGMSTRTTQLTIDTRTTAQRVVVLQATPTAD